jgi:hypothetical protein
MSSLTGLIAGGGGGGGAAAGAHSSFFKGQIIFLDESQTYTFLKSGTARIVAVGGGGSGAFCYMNYNNTNTLYVNGFAAACGGGAGGFTMVEDVKVASGDTLTVVIGAAGITNFGSGNSAWNGGVQVGTAGGTTTVNSSIASGNISLTANGGAGGGLSETGAANGGAGGTGSGGNVNRTGGAGGNIGGNNLANPTVNNNTRMISVATGGGSVGVFGNVGFDGGDFNKNSANNQSAGYAVATGGAGIGGNGGTGSIGNTTFGFGGGGGSNGAGGFVVTNNNTGGASGGAGGVLADYPGYNILPVFSLDGPGGTSPQLANTNNTRRSGGGGGGGALSSGFVTTSPGDAGLFSGEGAVASKGVLGANNFSHISGNSYGGGGGGFATSAYTGNTGIGSWAKQGGSGIVIIDLIPD